MVYLIINWYLLILTQLFLFEKTFLSFSKREPVKKIKNVKHVDKNFPLVLAIMVILILSYQFFMLVILEAVLTFYK
jgi:hypothetical protein